MLNLNDRHALIEKIRENSQSEIKCFAFHYAGGGASMYRLWTDHLPDVVDLYGVMLPGRERRIHEPYFLDVDSILKALLPECQFEYKNKMNTE